MRKSEWVVERNKCLIGPAATRQACHFPYGLLNMTDIITTWKRILASIKSKSDLRVALAEGDADRPCRFPDYKLLTIAPNAVHYCSQRLWEQA